MKSLLLILSITLVLILTPIVFSIQLIRKSFRKESLPEYFHVLAIGLDQLGGSIIYGYEDWCISSIAYYDASRGKNIWFMKFINLLFQDPEHCKKSYEGEEAVLGKPNR